MNLNILLKKLIFNCSNKNIREYILCKWYKKHTKLELNLKNPQTFNEKINWLKLYDSTPIKTKLADKYLVRDWIKEQIGEEYLIPLLGVWKNAKDIDFDKLPDKFVLKCNHGSSYNIIVKDKSKINKKEIIKKLNKWLKEDFAFKGGYELHYSDIPRRIIAEKYLEPENSDLRDYKFLCFSGNVKYIWVDDGRYTNHKRNLYDINWNLIKDKKIAHYEQFEYCPKPFNFEKMKNFAEKLSKDFCCVRVDFYENNQKLYFGEMTFTSESGSTILEPEEFDLELGQYIILPNKYEKK